MDKNLSFLPLWLLTFILSTLVHTPLRSSLAVGSKLYPVGYMCSFHLCTNGICHVLVPCTDGTCVPQAECLQENKIPLGVNDVCINDIYSFVVLTGSIDDYSSLAPHPCEPKLGEHGCPYGSVCVEHGKDGGHCCYGIS